MLSKEKEESETDYSDMEDTGYVIQQNSNVHTQEMPTATEATDERASTVCALLCTLSKPKSPMQERAIIYITDSDIYLIVEFKFDPRVVSPQSRLRVSSHINYTVSPLYFHPHLSPPPPLLLPPSPS